MAEPSDKEKINALRLIRSANVGPVNYHRLLEIYGSTEQALEALPELAKRGGSRKFKICSKNEAEKELSGILKCGADIILHGHPPYPRSLAHIPDAPPVLTVIGNLHLLNRPCVAIVGTRNASAVAVRLAEKLAYGLGSRDYVVVSGMARGVDAAAHRAGLKHGSIAALAGGIDHIYPAENEKIYRQLSEEGLLLAENPIGTQPLARHFPSRNRIISGLSLGVIVVEAAMRSGSLITARLAGEQGREVMAVPGSPMDPRCRGSNNLIRQGATLVETVDDALDVLHPQAARQIKEPEEDDLHTPVKPVSVNAQDRKRVLDLLGPTPVSVDEIISLSELPVPAVHMILLELELAGRLDWHPAQGVSLNTDYI